MSKISKREMHSFVEVLLGTLAKESIELLGRPISFLTVRYPYQIAKMVDLEKTNYFFDTEYFQDHINAQVESMGRHISNITHQISQTEMVSFATSSIQIRFSNKFIQYLDQCYPKQDFIIMKELITSSFSRPELALGEEDATIARLPFEDLAWGFLAGAKKKNPSSPTIDLPFTLFRGFQEAIGATDYYDDLWYLYPSLFERVDSFQTDHFCSEFFSAIDELIQRRKPQIDYANELVRIPFTDEESSIVLADFLSKEATEFVELSNRALEFGSDMRGNRRWYYREKIKEKKRTTSVILSNRGK